MVGVLSDIHFAPTSNAQKHLLDEGKKKSSVVVTGNTAIDALNYTVNENYQSKILERHKNKKICYLLRIVDRTLKGQWQIFAVL